jgi:hypothetical protein
LPLAQFASSDFTIFTTMNYHQPSASRSAKTSSNKLCGKPAGLVTLLASLGLAGAALGLAASPAQAQFAEYYAPANWTTSVQGDGFIDTSGSPGSISLYGANDFLFSNQSTDFTIAAPLAGTVSFDWSFSTSDGPFWDPFGYLLNGGFIQLSDDSSQAQSGSTSFSVLTGDVFGFRQNSRDSCCGRALTTISNFTAPVPGPLPLLGAGTAWGYSRRLRHRLRSPLTNSPLA